MKKKYKDVYYDVPDVKTIKELVIHGVGEDLFRVWLHWPRS